MFTVDTLDFYTDKQPEKYFIAALLQRAITDAYGEPKKYRDRREHYAISPEIQAEARAWLKSDAQTEGGAEWACQALGICRKSLINRIELNKIEPSYRKLEIS